MLGEHGDSSCVVWSSVRILGMTLDDYLSMEIGESGGVRKEQLAEKVRAAGWKIVAAKGYTAYGVTAAAGRVADAIINARDFPLSVRLDGEYGVRGPAVSVPCLVGSAGVLSIKQMQLTSKEASAFDQSAGLMANILAELGMLQE